MAPEVQDDDLPAEIAQRHRPALEVRALDFRGLVSDAQATQLEQLGLGDLGEGLAADAQLAVLRDRIHVERFRLACQFRGVRNARLDCLSGKPGVIVNLTSDR